MRRALRCAPTDISADAFDIGALKKLRSQHRFNKIFLDINGSRDVSAVTKLISIYADGWEDSNATGAFSVRSFIYSFRK